MLACPICAQKTFSPLSAAFTQKPLTCPNCKGLVVPRRSARDFLAFIPLALGIIFARRFNSFSFELMTVLLSGVLGLGLALILTRLQALQPPASLNRMGGSQ